MRQTGWYDPQQDFPGFESGGTKFPLQDSAALRDLLAHFTEPGAHVLEIGSYTGISTTIFLDELRDPKIYCVDTWCGSSDTGDGINAIYKHAHRDAVYLAFLCNFRKYLWQNVFPLRCESVSASMLGWEPFDVIFIDGDHRVEAVMNDITHWRKHLKPGGLLCGHDYGVFPGVKAALDKQFVEYEHDCSIWWDVGNFVSMNSSKQN